MFFLCILQKKCLTTVHSAKPNMHSAKAGSECESTKGQSTAAVACSVLPFLLPFLQLQTKFDFLRDTVTKKFKSHVLLVMEGRSFSCDEGKQKDKDKNKQCWICAECLDIFLAIDNVKCCLTIFLTINNVK